MEPLEVIGRVCAGSHTLERGVVWLGHRYPDWRLTKSLCYHTGEQAFQKEPDGSERIAVLWNGTRMKVTLGDHAFRDIYFYGADERAITQVVKHLAEPGQVWLDVGANVGYFTMLLSSMVGSHGRVYAFEPNPVMAAILEQSLHLNNTQNVSLVCAAVAESSGNEVILHIPIDRTVYGGSMSGRASMIAQRDIVPSQYHEMHVATVSLDAYLADVASGQVDFMKVDVEGVEILAFKGMKDTLEHRPPKVIICEVSHYPDCLATPPQLIAHLMDFEYVPYRIRTAGLFRYKIGEHLDADLDKDMAFVHQSAPSLVEPLIVS